MGETPVDFLARQTRVPAASLNAPSGIAQLRKSSEHTLSQPEPMNLDDYINNENVGTPAGLSLTPTPDATRPGDDSRTPYATASAIPIKNRKESAQHLVPQSVPVAVHHQRAADEFNYVSRHLRKTSIDETSRRVSWPPRRCAVTLLSICAVLVSTVKKWKNPSVCRCCGHEPFDLICCAHRTGNDRPTFLLKFLR